MELERIAAVIRPRSPWEAVDLGFRMVRAWWATVWRAWLVIVAPVWLVVVLVLREYPFYALVLLWWLKPLFDRVPLFVISRALFGALPDLRSTLRALPGLWGPRAIATAIFLRFDPARSFHLPVLQLEGGRGTALRQRLAVLRKESLAPASWLTVACLHMEGFSLLALFAFVGLMVPETTDFRWWEMLGSFYQGEAPLWFYYLYALLTFLALSLVEPFYVAGGFALYLDRRTRLEGWHIELAFRRLARRLTAPTHRTGSRAVARQVAVFALVSLSAWMAVGAPLNAQLQEDREALAAVPEPADPETVIREILEQPEFGTRQKIRTWRPRGSEPSDRPPTDSTPESRAMIPVLLVDLLATLLEVVLWAVVAVAAVFLILQLLRRMPQRPTARPEASGPKVPAVFGLTATPESFPANVPEAALRLWESGRLAEALGLLYRAAIVLLVRDRQLEVKQSWTEGDCLRLLCERLPPERVEYFTRLTSAWQSTAYAHRPPADDEVRALCSGWNRHVERTS